MQPTLYLLMGYPGSGKTTTARALHEATGAVHLWADQERKERFKEPVYSQAENTELYNWMNEETARLLTAQQSVIFDTNFNYYHDRQKLRQIAEKLGAKTVLIWVQAPLETAKQRATADAHLQASRTLGNMSEADFTRLVADLEPPHPDEQPMVIDGTKITPEYISSLFVKN